MSEQLQADEIVITGFSGRYPESENVEEFKKNLYEHVDMVNDEPRRWQKGLNGLPTRLGKLKDHVMTEFDMQFFGVHQKQADCMDPQMRLALETTYEAIIDAGYNPQELRGTKTGVYFGLCSAEAETYWMANDERINGYGVTGCSRAMFANRISYSFDLCGPSYSIDTACSSSVVAMEQAFYDIKTGKCDQALVVGTNVVLRPAMSLQFYRLGMLAPDGACRVFDADGSGYVRSDACVTILIQKASKARRVYATVLNCKVNTDGFSEEGITYPSSKMQTRLMKEIYSEAQVDPADVTYIEAHGTGTKAGDPQEISSICSIFCPNRKEPVLIGAVKSNMGHSEASSGLCAISKVLLAMEEGVLPANLHFNKPNPDLTAIIDGRIKVVDENTPWNGGIVALNSFGFGGANAHVILKSNTKLKSTPPKNKFSQIVVTSGRTEEAVRVMLDSVQKNNNDYEYIGLINQIHSQAIPLHNYRGYAIIDGTTKTVSKEVVEVSNHERPIWFIYSGMGSQWPSMARDLMQVDVFRKSIERSADALRPMGLDLVHIVAHSDASTLEDMVSTFVAITSVQVALTDLLKDLGFEPDGLVGHSAGELGCAYGDGVLTAEQTVLSAYYRGKSIFETSSANCLMASVGLSVEECHKILPRDVYAVCHNSADNVTIAGPANSVNNVLKLLKTMGVFAKLVNSNGYAFHSKYISDCVPVLQKHLDQLVPHPKERTSRWISSSVPESGWNTPASKLCSAKYIVNNLMTTVLFHEAVQHVTENAICIEIAPHGLMQAIVKRSLKSQVHVSLMSRGNENNLNFMLTNLGRIFNAGGHPQISKLYAPMEFPVSHKTPMLNSSIRWDHSLPVFCPKYDTIGESQHTIIEIDLAKEKYNYIGGHDIDGRILFPATGYLELIWRKYVEKRALSVETTGVVFENVTYHQATIVPKEGNVQLAITFFDASNMFEICSSGTVVVTGKVYIPEDMDKEFLPLKDLPIKNKTRPNDFERLPQDIYKELRLRGYEYKDKFQGVAVFNTDSTAGKLVWEKNWVTFMDTMLQVSILGNSIRELFVPTRIERIVIDPIRQANAAKDLKIINKSHVEMPVSMYSRLGVLKSGGVQMKGVKSTQVQRRIGTHPSPTLEKYGFVPFTAPTKLNRDAVNNEDMSQNALSILMQRVMENSSGALRIKGCEVLLDEKPVENLHSKSIQAIIETEPTALSEVVLVTDKMTSQYIEALTNCGIQFIQKNPRTGPVEENCHFILAHDTLKQNDAFEILSNLLKSIKPDGFLILADSQSSRNEDSAKIFSQLGVNVISNQYSERKAFILLRPKVQDPKRVISIIYMSENSYSWLADMKAALVRAESGSEYIYLISQRDEYSGAMGLMNCLKNEAGGRNVRLYFIYDKGAPAFDIKSTFYSSQIQKDLIMNVYKDGQWGSYMHLKLKNQNDGTLHLPVEHSFVNTLVKGDLSSLRWIESPLSRPRNRNPKKELCTVYYAPLNFKDVMLSSGKLGIDAFPKELQTEECVIGLEMAGRDSSGRRIMAISPAKCLATTCEIESKLKWYIPDHWTMEQASSVPCVYSTAYYAIMMRGKAKKGESILIHAGCGGVGQAAISISLHMGLTVFTTVSTSEKVKYLLNTFPKLNPNFIGNSRDSSFEQMIMSETDGDGVDLVLNSLSGDNLLASVRCLRINGRFLEIGKSDLNNNSPLGMSVFLQNTEFHGVVLDSAMDSDIEMAEVNKLVQDGIASGAVIPLKVNLYDQTQVEGAFRYMASGRHIGKIVIQIREEEKVKVVIPVQKLTNSLVRTYFHGEKSYIIVGGLGGFGLELGYWLVLRGVKNLVLTSRSGVKTGYQSLMIRQLEERGVKIKIDTNDVTSIRGCQHLIREANKMGPVGGIFNLALVLRDGLIQDLTESDFKTVCAGKFDAAKNLDVSSRSLCPELNYFVCFSSLVSGRGNIGQTNYGFANSAMERICENRQNSGLPGTAIQWGAIGDTGVLIDMLGDSNSEILGLIPQRMSSCLQTLDYFLQLPYPVMGSMVVAEKRTSKSSGGVNIVESVLNVLGIKNIKDVQENSTLAMLGIDSLMVTEVKQTLERHFDIIMNINDIRQITIEKLQELDCKRNNLTTTSKTDNIMACNFILLPTKCVIRLDNNRNATGPAVFMVHPIEGVTDALVPLAAQMKCPVYGLQCIKEAPLDSVSQLATYYIQQIREVQKIGPYFISGYSFGTCIAFEMVVQLEKLGEKCQLALIDGSPKFVTSFSQEYLLKIGKGQLSANESQSSGLAFYANLVTESDFTAVYEELNNLSSFEEKLQKCAEILKPVLDYPILEIKDSAESFYKKVSASNNYKPENSIVSPVMLVRPKEFDRKYDQDYGLTEICKHSVTVNEVNGDHRTCLQEPIVENVANVLQKFFQ